MGKSRKEGRLHPRIDFNDRKQWGRERGTERHVVGINSAVCSGDFEKASRIEREHFFLVNKAQNI